MSTAELDTSLIFNDTESKTAPLPGAVSLYPDNVIGFPKRTSTEILDVLLRVKRHEGSKHTDAVSGIKEYLEGLIPQHFDSYKQSDVAAAYAVDFHDEIDIDLEALSRDQQSNLVLAKLYLSGVASFARLDQLVFTRWRKGKKTDDFHAAKLNYLEARKIFQDDVDSYFEHFKDEPERIALDTLMDISDMGWLTIHDHTWMNAENSEYTYMFLGSVLSERLVKDSLKQYVHPAARYSEKDEDASPIKADVVLPIPKGDLYVQVKMNMDEGADLEVRPRKKQPRIVVPMSSMRTELTDDEHSKIAESIKFAAERKTVQLQIQDACTLSGLNKYIQLFKIPAGQYRAWWKEFSQVLVEERRSLQTGVDKVE